MRGPRRGSLLVNEAESSAVVSSASTQVVSMPHRATRRSLSRAAAACLCQLRGLPSGSIMQAGGPLWSSLASRAAASGQRPFTAVVQWQDGASGGAEASGREAIQVAVVTAEPRGTSVTLTSNLTTTVRYLTLDLHSWQDDFRKTISLMFFLCG